MISRTSPTFGVPRPIQKLFTSVRKMQLAEMFPEDITPNRALIPVRTFEGDDAVSVSDLFNGNDSTSVLPSFLNASETSTTDSVQLYDVSAFAKEKGIPIKNGLVLAHPDGNGEVFECIANDGTRLSVELKHAPNKPLDTETFRNTVGKALRMIFATNDELGKISPLCGSCTMIPLDYDSATRKADFGEFMNQQLDQVEVRYRKYIGVSHLSKKEEDRLKTILNSLKQAYYDILYDESDVKCGMSSTG